MNCDNCRWFNKTGFVPGFGDCTLNREVHSEKHEACKHYEECEPQQHGEWTTESAIDYLTEIGWLPEHDRVLTTERPHGEWTTNGNDLEYICSVCGDVLPYSDEYDYQTNFCPNCGASMVKEGDIVGNRTSNGNL